LEKQEKNDKKKENEEFLDRLVINAKTVVIVLSGEYLPCFYIVSFV